MNVHPQKAQVRLREEELLTGVARRAVESALAKTTKVEMRPFTERLMDFSEVPLVFNEPERDAELTFAFEESSAVVHFLFGHFMHS